MRHDRIAARFGRPPHDQGAFFVLFGSRSVENANISDQNRPAGESGARAAPSSTPKILSKRKKTIKLMRALIAMSMSYGYVGFMEWQKISQKQKGGWTDKAGGTGIRYAGVIAVRNCPLFSFFFSFFFILRSSIYSYIL